MHQKHKLECDICQSKFAKESTLKYHNQVWYCEACDSNFECEHEFIDHAEDLDHYLVKNLRPNWSGKIANLEMFNCDLCGARFNEEKELEDHIQVCYCIDYNLKFNNQLV